MYAHGRGVEKNETEAASLYRRAAEHYLTQVGDHSDVFNMNRLAGQFATGDVLSLRDPSLALELAQKAVGIEPSDGELWKTLAAAQYSAGNWQAALTAMNNSIQRRQGDGAPNARVDLGHLLWQIGDAQLAAAKKDDALKTYERALKCFETLAADYPQERFYRQETAHTHRKLAQLYKASGELPQSVAELRKSIEIGRALSAEAPGNSDYKERVASTYTESAVCLMDSKHTQEAVEACRQAIRTYDSILEASNTEHDRWMVGIGHEWVGGLLRQLGQLDEAELILLQAVDIASKLTDESNTEDHRFHLGRSYEELGHLFKAQHRLDKAIEAYRQAQEIWRKLVADFNDQDRRNHLMWAQQRIIEVLILQAHDSDTDAELPQSQRKTKAQGFRDQALSLLRDSIKTGGWANNIAWPLATDPDLQQRDPTLAVEFAKLAVEHASDDDKGIFLNTLGVAQYRAGQWQSAVGTLQESMKHRSGGDPEDWFFLAMAYGQLGQKDEARQWYDKATKWMKDHESKNWELQRFQEEASKLLKIENQKASSDGQTPPTEPQPAKPQ
jgi:tetratricopeptide (TPR) repeat protein